MTGHLSNERFSKEVERLNELKKNLKLKFSLEVITPEKAEKWLKINKKNRRSDGPRACSYVRQMLDGVWGFSGQPIIISDTNLLLDGGGRCSAVVSSNVPILCTVIRGVPESSFMVMDMIKTRRFIDTLEASHYYDGEKHSTISCIASMTKRIMEWSNGRYGSHGAPTTRTVSNNMECLGFVKNNLTNMRDCAKACIEMRGAHREKLVNNKDYFGSFMAYLLIDKGWDYSDVYKFFDDLTNIHSVIREEGNPITTLRYYLRQAYCKELHITDEERFHMFSRAWNAYQLGENVIRFNLKKCKDVPFSKGEFMERKIYA